MWPKNISLPKTVDLPCFLFRAAVFIHLESLFAVRFKLCEICVVRMLVCAGLYVCVCVCVCVCV